MGNARPRPCCCQLQLASCAPFPTPAVEWSMQMYLPASKQARAMPFTPTITSDLMAFTQCQPRSMLWWILDDASKRYPETLCCNSLHQFTAVQLSYLQRLRHHNHKAAALQQVRQWTAVTMMQHQDHAAALTATANHSVTVLAVED